jgi:hypothetical protein
MWATLNFQMWATLELSEQSISTEALVAWRLFWHLQQQNRGDGDFQMWATLNILDFFYSFGFFLEFSDVGDPGFLDGACFGTNSNKTVGMGIFICGRP